MKTGNRVLTLLVVLNFVLLLTGSKIGHAAPTYQGREEGAEWRQKALARIERIRKSELTVEIVDGKGGPLPGAQVKVTMQRHTFAFGSAVTGHDLTAQTSDGKRYRQIVEKNFNKVVFENDLKWDPWEISQKNWNSAFYRMVNTDNVLSWLNQRGITVRGHCAIWGHLEGDAGTAKRKKLPAQDFRAAVVSHAEGKVRTVGSRVAEWDVVNHPIGWGKGTMADLFGPNFYDSVFEQVAQWNPQAKRYINEGGVLPHNGYNREKYFRLLSDMLARGAKIEGIGFMGHFKADRDLASPEELLATFDRFAKLDLPLQVTEFDVRFGSEMNKPYPLTPGQEALQADYMRDFLIAAFSHPSLEGVVMWGFWEGRHWYPDAALYSKDWTIKPNGRVWEDLVLRQWWTNAKGDSDAKGRFVTRGFLGKYVIEATHKGKKGVISNFKLDRPGGKVRVVVD